MAETLERPETNDIVLDILQRVYAVFVAEKALTPAHFEQIEREVRMEWASQQPYINKKSLLSERRREIIRMARAGVSFAMIGKHFHISRQRAYQIYIGD